MRPDGTPDDWRPVRCDFTWLRSEDWRVFRVILEPENEQELRDADSDLLTWPPLPTNAADRFEHAEYKAVEWMQRAKEWQPK